MATPPYLQPFVLPVAQARRQRDGNLDAYWPDASSAEPAPAIVFIHGGPIPADDIAAAVERARALPGVDPDRVALWFFSGGGLLSADWLWAPPAWLRCLALTYPVLAPLPERDPGKRFHPVEAMRTVGALPTLLTRVGRERPEIAASVDAFTGQAELHGAKLTVIDVPEGQHGFDTLDHDESSRLAVRQAMTWVVATLRS